MTPPPRVARALLAALLPRGLRADAMLGDLLEELDARARRSSPWRARWWYRRAACSIALRAAGARLATIPRATRASLLGGWSQDLRASLRALAAARTFTVLVLVTLSAAIGTAVAIFAVVDGMLLKPLPYRDAGRLAVATSRSPSGARMAVSWPDFLDWRRSLTSVSALTCYRGASYTLSGASDTEQIDGRQVCGDFFDVLGVSPIAGRSLSLADDRPAGVHPIMLGYAFWRSHFGGRASAVGETITLDGHAHVIVGVLPDTFNYGRDDAVYEAIGVETSDSNFLDRGNHQGINAIGRLRPGRDLVAMRAELEALAKTLAATYPKTDSGNGVDVETIAERRVGSLGPTMRALLGAVSVLVLLACANVAGLLVARGVSRRHELAIRAALGSGRWRLVRQLLIETAVLTAAGGIAGVEAGAGLVRLLVTLFPPATPRLADVQLDARVIVFGVVTSLVCAVTAGIVPAVVATRRMSGESLVRAGRGTPHAAPRLRRALVAAQIGLATMLLAGAGLMARTMHELATVPLGFDPSHLIAARVSIPSGDEWPAARVVAAQTLILDRVSAMPGVSGAAFTMSLPINGSEWGSVFMLADRPVPPRADLPNAAFAPSTASYFTTMGIGLVAGRTFDARDTVASPPVAVVNETLARAFWPDVHDAVGQRLKQGWPEWSTPLREIVGVVRDVKLNGTDVETPQQIYLPMTQSTPHATILVLRSTASPAALETAVKTIVREAAPGSPVYDVMTMDDLRHWDVTTERLSTAVFATFAGIALVLAAIGLIGVISHTIADRTREIGVRVALGASRAQVLALFLRQGAITTAAGVVAGVLGALALSRFLSGLLFQVTPTDPLTLAAVAAILASVALLATYVPARRALRVDPTVALRGD